MPVRDLGAPVGAASAAPVVLDLARRRLDLTRRIAVMGIVNTTPDSFYDRGATSTLDAALAQARRLVDEGADVIDVGGIKGGPGPEVTVAEEIGRVIPLLRAFREDDPATLVSVDTWRAPVAAAALDAGADLVNDVTGASDPEILAVVAAAGAGFVAMHHGGEPRTRPFRRGYTPDVTTAVVEHLTRLTERAVETGVDRQRIVIDPGHDFQKTTYHSLELCQELPRLAALGYPVLVALSNKDFIGETLDAALEDRVGASVAAAVFAVLMGARIVRVHEVATTRTAVTMTEALLGWRPPAVAVRGLA